MEDKHEFSILHHLTSRSRFQLPDSNVKIIMLPTLAGVIAYIFWSSSGTVSKILLQYLSPFELAFFRFAIASLVIVPIFLRYKLPPTKTVVMTLIPISLLSVGNIAFFYLGLQRTTANTALIIYMATPLLVAIFAHFILKEHLTRKKLLGIIVGFIGVLIVTLEPVWHHKAILEGDLLGNFLIILATISWAFYTIASRRLTSNGYSAVVLTAYSLIVSAFVFAIFALPTLTSVKISAVLIPSNLLLILHLAVGVTVFTYLLYQWAIKHSTASTAAISMFVQPISGVILNTIILHEVITGGFILGSILAFAGVAIATLRVQPQNRKKKK